MVTVIFFSAKQGQREIQAEPDSLLLDAALGADIAGIIGDCGGALSCGTCHIYVDEAFVPLLPEPSQDERAMIDDGVIDPQPNSRLACQIKLTPSLDGLRVTAGVID